MSDDTLLFCIARIITSVFVLYELYNLYIAKGKTGKVKGTAVDIHIVGQGRSQGEQAN